MCLSLQCSRATWYISLNSVGGGSPLVLWIVNFMDSSVSIFLFLLPNFTSHQILHKVGRTWYSAYCSSFMHGIQSLDRQNLIRSWSYTFKKCKHRLNVRL